MGELLAKFLIGIGGLAMISIYVAINVWQFFAACLTSPVLFFGLLIPFALMLLTFLGRKQ